MPRSCVKVENSTRATVLADHAELANSPWRLLVGLIPYRRLDPGQGMVLPRTGSIHTVGVRFEIDVIFLDRAGRVLSVRRRVRPFRVAWAPRGTCTAVELPGGMLHAAACEPGDLVVIEPA
ncbi:MAG: DUF192 domain-containing protein [Chloroflexi bacterium]|nr:DUF192 domain-containing protein [Chloroflexota bacterium]